MAGRIESYGVIGELRTTSLDSVDGSIDWLRLLGSPLDGADD